MAEPITASTQGAEPPAAVPDGGASCAPAHAEAVTPMMAQYLALKREHPDRLLFYRMGDFYELFFDDAVKAAEALDIALTKRGRHDGADIPMCGVPVHSAETYLDRLIRKGFRVAVCEQMEEPAAARLKRGAKALVARDVVRLVTPGTITEDALLDARRPNYLVALARAGERYAVASADMSTGELIVQPVAPGGLAAELARLRPGELLVSETLLQEPSLYELFGAWKAVLTPQASSAFDSQAAERRLKEVFAVASLDAFGGFGRAEVAALGALIEYIRLTQRGRMPRLARPRRLEEGAIMAIDAATRRNLELVESLSGARKGSLLDAIDRSVTGAGARLLLGRLGSPLTDVTAIEARLDEVGYFVSAPARREALRAGLRRVPDLERAMSRLSVGRGGPRDLAAIRNGLAEVPAIRAALDVAGGEALAPAPPSIAALAGRLGVHDTLVDRLSRALIEAPGPYARDGRFIARGYHAALDEQVGLRDESMKLIAKLEARYRDETGVPSLKIRHNNVLGYYVEVTPTHAPKIASPFIHRQTLAGAVRFTTEELAALENAINHAADKALALELEIFEQLMAETMAHGEDIARAAGALAALDVAASLATVAVERGYVRPTLDRSTAFTVKGGRHAVVEALAEGTAQAGRFVPNDCELGEAERLWLVTGPNMAGKSTFLRQNALIAILAQMGSFVPAEAAHIGVVDRLFSRVGAADDLARGRSTFMVEMIETAAILNQATERSLVILDEIGRGTATFDGLSIAWATVEQLHDANRCRALFATHYHELTALKERLGRLGCYTMRVKEWQGEVVFLHEVAPGAADRSYGIHVAKLAGLPAPVIARAEEVLATLEAGEPASALARLAHDLPLFAAARPKPAAVAAPNPALEALEAINPDELTPKAALELLYKLKAMLR
ncbi:MAG: DNA mismatch repair protein MutS [Alphaproteobacteria bacterium]